MDTVPGTVIVVPCFDEERRLRPEIFVEALLRHPGVEFLFVDDGSRDRTSALLATIAGGAPGRVRTVTLAENRGKAEAVRQGFLAAARTGADVIGYWDADLATPLENLDAFLAAMANPRTLVALGSRVQLLGSGQRRRLLRHYLGRVFASCASLVLGLAVYDTQCGAKLFRRTPEIEAVFARPFRTRWLFDVEILARLLSLGPSGGREREPEGWMEVPVRRWHDVGGSKVRVGAFLTAPGELLGIARRLRAARRGAGPV